MNAPNNSSAAAIHNLPGAQMLVLGVRGTLGAQLAAAPQYPSTMAAAEPGASDDLNVAGAFEDQAFLCLALLAVACLTLLGVGFGALKLRNNTLVAETGASSALV